MSHNGHPIPGRRLSLAGLLVIVTAELVQAAALAAVPYDQVVTALTTLAAVYLTTLAVALLLCGLARAFGHIRELRHHLARALTDPVTGLPVRRVAEDTIVGTDRTIALTVALADVDRLHEINLGPGGHTAGDLYLAEVAARLRQAVTGDDTVARLGGDEFVLISRRDPAQIAHSLTAALASAATISGIERPIEVSIGICQLPGGDPHQLLACSSLAMLTAKARHTGIEFYNLARDGLPLPPGVRPAVRRRDQRPAG